jgi:serine/threonine-protein kinase
MPADHHLLFGLLALQTGLIDQAALFAAFHAWTQNKTLPLADQLVALGYLDPAHRPLLEGLAAAHLARHDGDVERSLAAVPAGRSTRESLAQIADADIAALIGHLGAASTQPGDDADRTASYGVGTATSDGLRFRVLRPHARGGLGAVFVALDTELHREVALKQMRDSHADDPASRQRFLVEAEITGGLEHPGVVPVYGLGTYADGRPFYAMRFIRGDSLKEAIESFHGDDPHPGPLPLAEGGRRPGEGAAHDPGRRSLELRRLLGRFLDVCNAIEYAHSRGVLHRDIKPGNIIVGKHGETLVVDWGLAKAHGRDAAESADEQPLLPSSASGSAETLPGSALGTPAYMSPEQAAGHLGRLGPRSDVYSLGATLYCLLTGKAPFEGDDIGEVLRKVQRGDFARPRQLKPSLDRALEAVCQKAMATNVDDRYGSCRALADDIERWMADEPVSAYREPVVRWARRWAKRNRTAVTAAAVALVAGVVGLSTVLAVQTRAKADIARALASETRANAALVAANARVEERYALAMQAIKTFHTGVSEDFLLKQDQFQELRDRLLNSAADFYGQLGALLGQESDVASRWALYHANFELAELTGKVGHKEDALAAHRAVLAGREALAAEPGAVRGLNIEVGRSLSAVAALLQSTGRTDEALTEYRRSESLLAGRAGADQAARAALAACRSGMGWLLSTTGQSAEALAAYRLARSDQEALATAPGATPETRLDLADTVGLIGNLLATTGQPLEAEVEFRRALAILEKLADDHPADTRFRYSLGWNHDSLGALLAKRGRQREAEAEYRRALTVLLKLAHDNPAVTDFPSQLAASRHNLAMLLAQTSKSSEAEAEYRQALAIQQKLADDHPAVTQFRQFLANHRASLGTLLWQMGKPLEGEAEYRGALQVYQKLAHDHPAITKFQSAVAMSHYNLGPLLWDLDKPSEAEAEARKAMVIYQKLAHDNPAVPAFESDLAGATHNLATLLKMRGRPDEALVMFERARASSEAAVRADPAVPRYRDHLARHHTEIGELLHQGGRRAEAMTAHQQARTILQKLADDHPNVPEYRNQLASSDNITSDLLRRLGRPAQARDGYERAVAIREALVQENPKLTRYRSDLAGSLCRRGRARGDLGDLAGAAADARRALAIWDKLPTRSGQEWFETACGQAALASLAGRDGSGVAALEGPDRADRAMNRLRKAVDGGYRNLDAFRTEPALDPLRSRDDYRLLMMDLAFPTEPFAAAH